MQQGDKPVKKGGSKIFWGFLIAADFLFLALLGWLLLVSALIAIAYWIALK